MRLNPSSKQRNWSALWLK